MLSHLEQFISLNHFIFINLNFINKYCYPAQHNIYFKMYLITIILEIIHILLFQNKISSTLSNPGVWNFGVLDFDLFGFRAPR